MKFWKRFEHYRNNQDFLDNFLLENDIVEESGIVESLTLETNHTFDRRESRASATSVISFQKEIFKIRDIEYGINIEKNTFDNYSEFLKYKKKAGGSELLDNSINDCKIVLEKAEHDNYKKEINLLFDFQGGMEELFVIDFNSFLIAIDVLALKRESPYWGKLLIQAIHIIEKKQFDLSFLLLFTAFENFITLLAEKHESDFYKEINLKKMELKSKMKLLLKHLLNIQPSPENEDHPSILIIEKLFSELYEIRNKIAHGGYREVNKEDCQKCLDLFIIFHSTVKDKPQNNNELLNSIKKYIGK